MQNSTNRKSCCSNISYSKEVDPSHKWALTMLILICENNLLIINIFNCEMGDKSIFVRVVRLMNLLCAVAMLVDAVFRLFDF